MNFVSWLWGKIEKKCGNDHVIRCHSDVNSTKKSGINTTECALLYSARELVILKIQDNLAPRRTLRTIR